MIQEIAYSGLSATPADYNAPDGDLALAINLIPEDGALRPVGSPRTKMILPSGNTVAFIHHTAAFTHYILYNEKSHIMSFVDGGSVAENGSPDVTPLGGATHSYLAGVTHFNAIGNTLIAFAAEGMHYFLWKDSEYIYLGDHIPEVDISFGLIGHPRLFSMSDDSKKTFNIDFDAIGSDALNNEFTETNKTRITEQVMAKVNKFIREQTVDKGRFCFPFFVRYALRLFDGSLINHSAPILMNPSTTGCPVVFWKHIRGKSSYTTAELDIMLVASSLDYKILNTGEAYNLEKWSDIVTGIEVFVSKPIYTFDQNGKCSSWVDTDNFDTKFIGRLFATNKNETVNAVAEDKVLGNFTSKSFLDFYTEWKYSQIYSMYFSADRSYPAKTLHLPEFTDAKVAETVANTSVFYKLRTLEPLDAYAARDHRTEIVIEDDYLQSLLAREVMTDDYLSHDTLSAESSYAFNSRLNLSGINRKPFRGFFGQSMFAWCQGAVSFVPDGTTLTVEPQMATGAPMSVTVYIKDNGREYAVSANDHNAGNISRFNSFQMTSGGQSVLSQRSWGCYLFYPNVKAHKMLVSTGATETYLVELRPHEFLNGAYALLDYEQIRQVNYSSDDLPQITYDPSQTFRNTHISEPNKIYTSEVNNPFYFPLQGINTVGSGRVLGICSAAKALSQGQFGQFPLYAFTDEGVWAMQVAADGTYSARQPITRDVCINPAGITQIDSSVLFPTDRGIMQISGSETRCLTDTVKTDTPFDLLSLPHMKSLHDSMGHPAVDSPDQLCVATLPFTEFLKSCRMVYDYLHQRVVVYNPDVRYAYVLSLKSGQWGMIYSNIVDNVNSYPDALAVDSNGYLVDFTLSPVNTGMSLAVTRPLKIGMPDVLKTVDTVIQRGQFARGHVQTVLYGSRDLVSWYLVWSSTDHFLRGFHGTPYKYFRIALLCRLRPGEGITGATVRFTPRFTNQPR